MKVFPVIAAAVLGCAVLSPNVGAIPITGAITISGGAVFDTGNLGTANGVTDFQNVEVESRDGSYTAYVNVGDSVTMAEPWVFDPSTATAGLWAVGGFTFDLTSSVIVLQTSTFLLVQGAGTVSGNGFDPTAGSWSFSTQSPSAAGVFSWSGSSESVPDGGLTILLLGSAFVGLGTLRRNMAK